MMLWQKKRKRFFKSTKRSTKNKLKNLQLCSVDFCEQGANPDADIALFKSANPVEKDARTFQQVVAENRLDERFWDFQNAFSTSFRSILNDVEPGEERKNLMLQSLAGFTTEITAFIEDLNKPIAQPPDGLPAVNIIITDKSKGVTTMKLNDLQIDVSGLSAEEQAQLAALVEKAVPAAQGNAASTPNGTPTPAPADSGVQKGTPTAPPAVPANGPTNMPTPELPDAVQKAVARYDAAAAALEARLEALDNQALDEIAKKYAPLNDSTIRETLGVMKKAGDQAYNSFVASLDRQLDLMQKADGLLLGEIGKSGSNSESSPVGKAEAIAKEYQKADPSLTIQQAMAKAFSDHPELVAEYNSEYEGRK